MLARNMKENVLSSIAVEGHHSGICCYEPTVLTVALTPPSRHQLQPLHLNSGMLLSFVLNIYQHYREERCHFQAGAKMYASSLRKLIFVKNIKDPDADKDDFL